jgi:excisionase family DNA binding protein
MPGDILSIPEAAAILGVSRIAVFKRVKSGAIPAFRVGRAWAIARESLPAAGIRSGPTAAARRAAAIPPSKKPPPSPPSAAPSAETPEELDSMGWD